MLALAFSAGLNSCSDDHFDIRQNGQVASNSIWANLEADADLDSLKMILERAVVLKSATDHVGRASYKEVLNSSQALTLWAPVNGSYPAYKYLGMLDEADRLQATGNDADLRKALDLRYKVTSQFVTNHMARFNYESNSALQTVHLLNAKTATFNKGAKLFNNTSIVGESVPSVNGTLYKLSSASPYIHNLWSYISNTPQFSELYATLSNSSFDYEEFLESASTPGAINNAGQMEYVDSVFLHVNTFLDASGALVENEDSTLFAAVPTNAAWATAIAKTRALYKYGTSYKSGYQAEDGGKTGKFRNEMSVNADSLITLNSVKAIVNSMFYSPWRYGVTNYADSAAVVHGALYADSLTSTARNELFNSAADLSQPNTHLNPFFEQPKQILKASNGYIAPLDQYNIDPAYLWIEKKEYDMASNQGLIEVDNSPTSDDEKNGQYVSLNAENRDSSVIGSVPQNAYRRYRPANNVSVLKISIKLDNILSGHYRIKVMLVPNRINKLYQQTNTSTPERIPFYAQIVYDDEDNVPNTPPIGSDKVSTPYLVDNDSVKTYTLFEDYEFTKCYAGLPSTVDSYARLVLVMPSSLNFGGFTPATSRRTANSSLNVVKVIVEPVR